MGGKVTGDGERRYGLRLKIEMWVLWLTSNGYGKRKGGKSRTKKECEKDRTKTPKSNI
jgi:hypothetical protein